MRLENRQLPEGTPADFAMGGQAVLEGVMMRGPKAYAVAVRRPQGNIQVLTRHFWPVTKRKKYLQLPILRGAVSLVEMLLLGYKSLDYSANVVDQATKEMAEAEGKTAEEPEILSVPENPLLAQVSRIDGDSAPQRSISRWAMVYMFTISMALAMLLFVALPNVSTHVLGSLFEHDLVEVERPILFNLVSGMVRLGVIITYILVISLIFKDVRRLFQYHGAEHKVVMAWEKGLPLEIEHIRPVTTHHPRCGTTFIAIVVLVSIFVFALLTSLIVHFYPPFAKWPVWASKSVLILSHIVFMPVVAGMAYEVTRRAGRRPNHWLYRFLLMPGLAFQNLTAHEPDDSMIEVALVAFREALDPDHRETIREATAV
ncbi:DUF1385 domain-containing protein [bacterium]|nr:DUF1385 domain-containing protein [bacterium]